MSCVSFVQSDACTASENGKEAVKYVSFQSSFPIQQLDRLLDDLLLFKRLHQALWS